MMCGLNKNFVFQLVSGEYGAGQGIVDGAVLPDCVPVNLVALFILPCLVHVGHAPREEVIAIARKLQIPEEARHLLLRANLVPILDSFLYHEVEEQDNFSKLRIARKGIERVFHLCIDVTAEKCASLARFVAQRKGLTYDTRGPTFTPSCAQPFNEKLHESSRHADIQMSS